MRLRLPRLLTAGLLVSAWGAQAAPAVSEAPAPEAQAPAPAPAIVLANHRAVYDLSLAEGGGTRAVDSARGRIVIDFRGDACRGYTMLTRQVTELSSGETGTRLSDMRSTTFEGGQGREFRFKTTTLTNNRRNPSAGTSRILVSSTRILIGKHRRRLPSRGGGSMSRRPCTRLSEPASPCSPWSPAVQ